MLSLRAKFLFAVLTALWLPLASHAATDPLSATLNMTDNQGMLAQKIAKSYFFLGENIWSKKAFEQLMASLDLFAQNHEMLKSKIQDEEIEEILDFIDTAFEDYTDLVKRPYSVGDGYKVLTLSETLKNEYQDAVELLKQKSDLKKTELLFTAGKLRMQSQRIAKYYVAYQAGFNDPILVKQLREAVDEFELTLKTLIDSKQNTADISFALARVKSLWKIVNKFYLDLQKGGLPVTVFVTADSITKKMDEITRMYEQITPATSTQ